VRGPLISLSSVAWVVMDPEQSRGFLFALAIFVWRCDAEG